MTDTTMALDAKRQVLAALVAHVNNRLSETERTVSAHRDASDIDQDSSFSIDDLSQADAAGDLTALFEQSTARQRATLRAIETLPDGQCDRVGPGALVGFGGARFVVGVTADAFTADDHIYEGISKDAPIYSAIEGLAVGDSFDFRGATHRIDFLA